MSRMKLGSTLAFLTALLTLTASALGQSDGPKAGETQPAAASGALSVVHVGNSHSHPLRLLTPLTAQTGHAGYKAGDINILGASLGWIWDHGDQDKWPETLAATNKWDAITLLSWSNDDATFAPKFAGELFKGNPKAQVFIYVIWPDSNMPFDNPPPVRTEAHGEEVAAAVAAAFPDAPQPRVIPTSLLMREIGRLADMGELPGVANRFELFSDGGHLSQVGQYALNVMVCAMLYGESPLGYPSDIVAKDPGGRPIRGTYQDAALPDATAAVIRRMVWDILQTYAPAGTKPTLVVGNRRIEAAIAGQPYQAKLEALHAQGASAWTLTSGTLPTGISFSADGVISGQSKAAGKYPVTVKLASGKDTFERSLVLSVNEDTPPSIPDQPLPASPLDAYVFQPFKSRGGVGTITWTLSDGKLPYGILLSPAGMLVGTPGEAGDFRFRVQAADSHPSGPRSAEKEFTWQIGPARAETLQVKYVVTGGTDVSQLETIQGDADIARLKIKSDSVLKIDGKLDEPFWRLDQAIEKKTLGTPTKKATFSAVWTASSDGNGDMNKVVPGLLYVGKTPGRAWKLTGNDLVLAIKVLDGPKGKTPKDGVHIFVDGRHDAKLIYGADDIHFFIPRDFKKNGEWAPMVRGLKAPWFSKCVVAEIDGGYVVEVSLGGANFMGNGQWLPLNAKSVYGFDLAVDEGEEGAVSQQVWRGDANDAEDTSHLGTIVLAGQPAAAAPQLETK